MNTVLATYLLLAQTIAPFIDEQTFAVGHLDLTRVDVSATFAKIYSLAEVPAGETDPPLEEAKANVAKWLADARQAGTKDLFVVVSLADMPTVPVRLVVPLTKDADAQTIRSLLFRLLYGPVEAEPQDRPGPSLSRMTAVAHNAVVIGKTAFIEQLPTMTPHVRPNLAQAFAAAGDSAVQLLVLPTADHRRVVEEMMPVLPAEVGGGPSTALTRGVRWAAIGLNTPPNMSLTAKVQSADAASAQALREVIQHAFAALGTWALPPIQEVMPGFQRLAAALTPTAQGDRLTLTLEAPTLDSLLAEVMAPAFRVARQQAKQAISASQLRAMGPAIAMYRGSHKNAPPPDLDALVKGKFMSPKALISPISGKRYVYIPLPYKAPESTIMAYDDPAAHGRDRTTALFRDTHVMIIKVDERFWQRVKEARALSEKAYGP